MLSSFTGDLAGAPDGQDAFFLVESFLETLGHLVTLQVLENLNVHTARLRVNQIVALIINIHMYNNNIYSYTVHTISLIFSRLSFFNM